MEPPTTGGGHKTQSDAESGSSGRSEGAELGKRKGGKKEGVVNICDISYLWRPSPPPPAAPAAAAAEGKNLRAPSSRSVPGLRFCR